VWTVENGEYELSEMEWCQSSVRFDTDPNARALLSTGAVDCDFESRADGAYPRVGEPAKPSHQRPDRDTFDCVQIHRRAARDRVGTRFENNLAGQPPDGRGARCDECPFKPRNRRIAREHDDWTPADLVVLKD